MILFSRFIKSFRIKFPTKKVSRRVYLSDSGVKLGAPKIAVFEIL